MKLTRSGYIIVKHPETGEQYSQHVQEREAVEKAANLARATRQNVTIRYDQTVLVEWEPEDDEDEDPLLGIRDPLWSSWGQGDVAFDSLDAVTFEELG